MSASRGRSRTRRPSPTGLQLDANDPADQAIIRRQIAAARRAGRDGRDRAASTRGRPDLEAAYDEGAQTSAPAADGGGTGSPAPGGKRGKGGAPRSRRPALPSPAGGPTWRQLRPTSPARPPTRVADAGGFLTGLALYTVVIIYVRYGTEGWKGWLKAKFLNKPLPKKGKAVAV